MPWLDQARSLPRVPSSCPVPAAPVLPPLSPSGWPVFGSDSTCLKASSFPCPRRPVGLLAAGAARWPAQPCPAPLVSWSPSPVRSALLPRRTPGPLCSGRARGVLAGALPPLCLGTGGPPAAARRLWGRCTRLPGRLAALDSQALTPALLCRPGPAAACWLPASCVAGSFVPRSLGTSCFLHTFARPVPLYRAGLCADVPSPGPCP